MSTVCRTTFLALSGVVICLITTPPTASASRGEFLREFRAKIVRRSQELKDPEVAGALRTLLERKALKGLIYDWEVYRETLDEANPARVLSGENPLGGVPVPAATAWRHHGEIPQARAPIGAPLPAQPV
jgi:hypothetical protein